MSEPTCGSCRWWTLYGQESTTKLYSGTCKRMPPTAPTYPPSQFPVRNMHATTKKLTPESIGTGYWPTTWMDDYCGEHEFRR